MYDLLTNDGAYSPDYGTSSTNLADTLAEIGQELFRLLGRGAYVHAKERNKKNTLTDSSVPQTSLHSLMWRLASSVFYVHFMNTVINGRLHHPVWFRSTFTLWSNRAP